jgi:hypothetical protein
MFFIIVRVLWSERETGFFHTVYINLCNLTVTPGLISTAMPSAATPDLVSPATQGSISPVTQGLISTATQRPNFHRDSKA